MSCCFLRSWFFVFFQSFPLPFPLLKFFSFNYLITFLVSFIWNSQKCPVSQNIWCLIKTQLKISTQTIFQGGSPWATLIHNSVVCLEGTLLCPAVSWGDFVFFCNHFLYLFLCYSVFLLWYFYGITIGFLWNSYGVSMMFLWYFWRISMGFLKGCYGSSMVFLWDFHWIPMGFLWYFYWIPMGFLWYFYWIPMEFLLDSCGISKVFPWCLNVSMIFLWDYYWNSHGISFVVPCYSMLFLWSFYGISVRFLWDFHGISMIFLWDYYWISMGCRLKVNWQ